MDSTSFIDATHVAFAKGKRITTSEKDWWTRRFNGDQDSPFEFSLTGAGWEMKNLKLLVEQEGLTEDQCCEELGSHYITDCIPVVYILAQDKSIALRDASITSMHFVFEEDLSLHALLNIEGEGEPEIGLPSKHLPQKVS
jgi:hypothetical protein